MNNTVKLIIEIPKETYEDLKSGKIYSSLCEAPQGLVEGIRNGTLLDSNSEQAEVQAYFDGQAYGWEQGRKALIDDVKAEIKRMEYHMIDCDVLVSQEEVLEILDNIDNEKSPRT